MQENWILKTSDFQSKLETFAEIKKNSKDISIFGYEKSEISNLYAKKYYEDKHVDSLLIGEKGKRHYILIKDFNTFMYG